MSDVFGVGKAFPRSATRSRLVPRSQLGMPLLNTQPSQLLRATHVYVNGWDLTSHEAAAIRDVQPCHLPLLISSQAWRGSPQDVCAIC